MVAGSLLVTAAWIYLTRDGALDAPSDPPAESTSIQLKAPPSAWRPIADPRPSFALNAPELAGLPQTFEARSHAGGSREEVLRFGNREEPTAYLHLAARWSGPEASRGSSFFVDLARRAAEAGFGVARSAQPSVVATRLGLFEVAHVGLSTVMERPCIAFRLDQEQAVLGLSGWFCGASTKPAQLAQLICLLDRLTLTSSADDLESRLLFAQAEPQRGESCGPHRSSATPQPTTGAQKDSSSRRRAKAPAADSASRDSRG